VFNDLTAANTLAINQSIETIHSPSFDILLERFLFVSFEYEFISFTRLVIKQARSQVRPVGALAKPQSQIGPNSDFEELRSSTSARR